MSPLPPSSTLFPYTTLFRSQPAKVRAVPAFARPALDCAHRVVPRRLPGREPSPARGTLAADRPAVAGEWEAGVGDRKSTRLNSSHLGISYAVFCLKKKKHT